MKAAKVVWRPRARDVLLALYDWIAERADPDVAFAYTDAIEAHTAKLSSFPERGNPRDDLAAGVRTLSYRWRNVIVYRAAGGTAEVLRLIRVAQQWDSEGLD